MTGDLEEVGTGRGSAGLVRRGDERCWADETSGNGKGKGKGMHQGMRTMKDDKEEEEHRKDVRKRG